MVVTCRVGRGRPRGRVGSSVPVRDVAVVLTPPLSFDESPDRFPHTILDICQQNDIDIRIGVVADHSACTSIHTLFLSEQDFPGIINSKT